MAQQYSFEPEMISDLHKDTYGMRPSVDFMLNWASSSNDVKQEIWDDLIFELSRVIAEEKADNDRAMVKFESDIRDRIDLGYDRKAAIRNIVGALEKEKDAIAMYGGSYVCYLLNLPFSMTTEIDRAIG